MIEVMAQRVKQLPVVISCLLLAACGGGGGSQGSNSGSGSGSVDPCSVAGQKEFVSETAESWYYWYDELADVNPDDYATAQAYLDALTAPLAADSRDPGFSYLTTVEADEARFTSGTYYGFGFRYGFIGDDFYFADTFEGSPAYLGGLRRGQRLLAVDLGDGNGFETWDSLVARGATNTEIFGPSDEAVTRGFRVESDGVTQDINVTKAEIETPPLAGEPILIEREGLSPVGYLHFRTFIDSADQPLRNAAVTFAQAGVTDLVFDLRYNGGGLLRVADTVLNLLGGDVANGSASYIVDFNDKHNNQDETGYFASIPQTFTPLRIAFITREGTASASEMVINGLAPHIEIALIGEDTYGKAVGQSAFDQGQGCDTRLRLISFEIQNGEGQGGYYTGLHDTGRFDLCEAEDGLTKALGDVEEASLNTALAWLNGDIVCAAPIGAATAAKGVGLIDDKWPINRKPPLNRDGGVRSF